MDCMNRGSGWCGSIMARFLIFLITAMLSWGMISGGWGSGLGLRNDIWLSDGPRKVNHGQAEAPGQRISLASPTTLWAGFGRVGGWMTLLVVTCSPRRGLVS